VHGRNVKDPWTGLKAIPAALIPALLDIKGEGNKYEFSIVLNLQHKGIKAVNVPVGAGYAFAEGSAFWDRAGDIFRVLILPFKFISASLVATLADYFVFILLDTVLIPGHWAISMTTSRSAGAVVGYFLNRSLVFKQKNNTWQKELAAAGMFALLALFNYGASMLIVYILHDMLRVNEIIARPISDALLFVMSYTIQREFIFKRGSPAVK
jgi:putative flippase GtrA